MARHSIIDFRDGKYTSACGQVFTAHARAAHLFCEVECGNCRRLLTKPCSWNVEASDSSGFGANGLYFTTGAEAAQYAADLFSRWMACKETRVVPSRHVPNYRWDTSDGLVSLERLKPAGATDGPVEVVAQS